MNFKARKATLGLACLVLLLASLACGLFSAVAPTATPTEPPTPTSPPTPTPQPLYLSVSLVSVPINETSQNPLYTVEALVPNLSSSTDERVTKFNNEMTQLTREEIAKFKDNARMGYAMPGSNGSSYHQTYAVLSAPGNLLSLKFEINTYIEGAAHPHTRSRTVNYDLEAGNELTLDQLFLPGSDYLKAISNYCIADLKTRPIDFTANSAGADPTVENYGSWNVTPGGLLITFDEYQVAAYALGPQLVTVPYSVLQDIIDPNGPLKAYLP